MGLETHKSPVRSSLPIGLTIRIVQSVGSLVCLLAAGRYWNPVAFGRLALVISTWQGAIVCAKFGRQHVVLRRAGSGVDDAALRSEECYLLRIWVLSLFGASFVLVAGVTPWIFPLLILSISSASRSLAVELRRIRGQGLRALAISDASVPLWLVGGILITRFQDLSATYCVILLLVSEGITLALNLVFGNLRGLSGRRATGNGLRITRENLVLLVGDLSAMMVNSADVIVVALCIGEAAAGPYATCVRLAALAAFPAQAYAYAAGPRVAELAFIAPASALKLVARAGRIGGALAALTAVSVLAALGLGLLPGVPSRPYLLVFGALALGQLVNSWTGPVVQLLAALGHARYVAVLTSSTGVLILAAMIGSANLVKSVLLLAAFSGFGTALQNLLLSSAVRRRIPVIAG